jgi:hypothetical protein
VLGDVGVLEYVEDVDVVDMVDVLLVAAGPCVYMLSRPRKSVW